MNDKSSSQTKISLARSCVNIAYPSITRTDAILEEIDMARRTPEPKRVTIKNLLPRNKGYIPKDHTKFGSGSPSWTIPAGRPEKLESIYCPGPGAYDVPVNPFDYRLKHKIMQRREPLSSSITSDIGFYMPPPIIDSNKPIYIGSITGNNFIPKIISPDPVYVPPSFGSDIKVKIKERLKPQPVDDFPGPGFYNPVYCNLERSPVYIIRKTHKPKKRARTAVTKSTPGPGEYNVLPQLKPFKNWTERIRVKSKRVKRESLNRLTPWIKPSVKLNW